jgi:sugar transferase (PEP-CTERM/EpsH1 system associated)
MPPPLIVHVIHRLAAGGLENGLVNLVNALPAERFAHAIVCLTDATDFARRIRRPDVPILELHKPPGNSLVIQRRLYRVLRQLGPTVVHTRNLATLEAQVAAAIARVPARIHGEHGWDVNDPDGTSRRYAAIRRLHSPLVHRYIALSGHIERYLRERVGIAPARISRICNGVDCARFAPSPSSRDDFPYAPFRDSTLLLVGTVGRLEPIKDQVNLARAFVAAVGRDDGIRRLLRLVIVGAGSLRPAIENVLSQGGVRELAWFAGEQADVPRMLSALDVFVLPSRAEGISNTILEAMACGVPVVATDVGGNAELVAAGVTGELVPPGDPQALADALARLARHRDSRVAFGTAARRRALEHFSLTEMVRQYAAVYDQEIERRAHRDATSAGTGRASHAGK